MTERICAVCGRVAPTPYVDETGMSPRVAAGWVSFETPTLIIDIPWEDDFTLPRVVEQAVRDHDGPVRFERIGPEITRATVREVVTSVQGLVCGDCYSHGADWSDDDWLDFFAVRAEHEAGA